MFSDHQIYIDIHSHHISFDESVFQIINIFPEPLNIQNSIQKYSMGLHPWYIDDNSKESLDIIENYLHKPEIIAIGECGLDKLCKTPFEKQVYCFEKQIMLADLFKKPMIIHCVKCIDELLEISKNTMFAKIIHGFSGNVNMAEQLINKGFYISMGTNVFTNHKIQEVIKQIPLEYLFLESDDKPNTIKSVYTKVSELRNIEIKELQNQINKNFNTIWNIG